MQQPLPFDQALSAVPQFSVPAFVFVRHARARRYVIRVRHDGTVRVTIPRRGSKREACAFADSQLTWIRNELARVRERPLQSPDDRQALAAGEQRSRARRELPERLLALAAQHGLTVARISVRNQRWRWGSCSRGGHVCLNWRLVTVPDWVRDYVLLHELMHLKRMDHSRKFWQLVAGACPGYQQARTWLRAHDSLLSWGC